MVEAWNNNMQKIFTPGWVSCLDESISVWTNKWAYPGYIFIPKKPYPMGNEYYLVCLGHFGNQNLTKTRLQGWGNRN